MDSAEKEMQKFLNQLWGIQASSASATFYNYKYGSDETVEYIDNGIDSREYNEIITSIEAFNNIIAPKKQICEKIERKISKYIELVILPQSKNKLGQQLLKNGKIVVCVINLITRFQDKRGFKTYLFNNLIDKIETDRDYYIRRMDKLFAYKKREVEKEEMHRQQLKKQGYNLWSLSRTLDINSVEFPQDLSNVQSHVEQATQIASNNNFKQEEVSQRNMSFNFQKEVKSLQKDEDSLQKLHFLTDFHDFVSQEAQTTQKKTKKSKKQQKNAVKSKSKSKSQSKDKSNQKPKKKNKKHQALTPKKSQQKQFDESYIKSICLSHQPSNNIVKSENSQFKNKSEVKKSKGKSKSKKKKEKRETIKKEDQIMVKREVCDFESSRITRSRIKDKTMSTGILGVEHFKLKDKMKWEPIIIDSNSEQN